MLNKQSWCCKTIGHSNLTSEAFIDRLQSHEIECLVDVRSQPYARFVPHFNRESLAAALKIVGIKYLFLGDKLGARYSQKELLTADGRVDLLKVGQTDFFRAGIDRVENGIAKGYKLALMCSEQDPLDCHRFVLVSRALSERGYVVEHILRDGGLASQTEVERRMLNLYGLADGQLSLFEEPKTEEESLFEAYKRRGLDIAYSDEE